MTDTDTGLLERAKGGDREAFGVLVDRWHRPVFAYALSQVRDRPAAEDVVQEVFLRAWKSVDSIEGAQALPGWLYAAARNCARESGRARKRFDRSRESPGGGSPVADARQERLLEILSELPDDARAVLSMKYMEDLTCSEISGRTGRPVGSVTSLLSRAYEMIRERMRENRS